MSDADARLAALLRADRPPAVDSRFRLGVLEGQTRQRLRTRLGLLMVAGGSVTAALSGLAPRLAGPALIPTPILAGVGLALAILLTLWGMMQARRPI